MRLRASFVSFLALAAAIAAIPAACAPDSSVPSGTTTTSTGEGGGLFDTGTPCADPADADGDFVADGLELAPDGDTDGDGQLDKDDLDSDGDTVQDADEAQNALLDPSAPGQMRDSTCDALADTDADGVPDLRDKDSDNDGVPDEQEASFDPTGRCRVVVDCDGDGVIDLIELAAGSDPNNPASAPDDPGLYFVLPYRQGEQTKDFTFSTGVERADIYFLIDTTQSMQPAIDQLKASLSTEILPAILNGDPGASPPIPPIGDAWIGVGDFRDVPWAPYGQPGDDIYRNRFSIAAQTVVGSVAAPVPDGSGGFAAPPAVQTILGALTAGGGGDGPEALSQALWIASTSQPYAATIGGLWSPATPYPAPCSEPGMFGVPCFRPQALPIFVVVTDAAFHNGPLVPNAYNPQIVGGTRTYADAVSAVGAIDAKMVGVPVAGGNPGAARLDLSDLATQTGSLYHDPQFGGADRPLVAQTDVASGQVSSEVVRLLGLLAGAGLHDVTTDRKSYDCAGNVDCTGDGQPDLEYHNPVVPPGNQPFDASQLITAVTPVESPAQPPPYGSLDATTFHGVRGAAEVTFRVHAANDVLDPGSLVVLRAVIRVVTPSGQLLGGADGIKLVYFVIPQSLDVPE